MGTVEETSLVNHKILVPPGVSGIVEEMACEGDYRVEEQICLVNGPSGKVPARLMHTWPVRTPRPFKRKVPADTPLVTGQRIIDFLFPITKGGTAAIPGGFGTGKTVMQQQLVQWADADIIVYVGCGERGNEMAEVLERFPKLKDPKSGKPLMDRTVLFANTSNMPIAAREASVYTGITVSEYFRDMSYDVALMADSTSRWAEALREISAAREEVPGRRGYPGYMYTDLATIYERAGRTHGSKGSVTQMPILTMPHDDMTHPIPDLTGYITEGQVIVDRGLYRKGVYPPIDVSPSLSRLMKEGIGKGRTREDHREVSDQLYYAYAEGRGFRDLVAVVGEEALSARDKLYLKFADAFERRFVNQGVYEDRDIEETLDLGWELLTMLPEGELKRIDPQTIKTYHPKYRAQPR
ncbi:MAG: V-type ATP synthase subunit B [Candidatus Bathyarchaeia archaeon]